MVCISYLRYTLPSVLNPNTRPLLAASTIFIFRLPELMYCHPVWLQEVGLTDWRDNQSQPIT